MHLTSFSFFLFFFFCFSAFFIVLVPWFQRKTFPCSLNLCCVPPLNKISVTKNLLKYSTTFLFFPSLFSSKSLQILKSVKFCFPWLISLFSRIPLGWALWVFCCSVGGWHHGHNGHEFEQAPGDGKEQGSLACYTVQGVTKSRHAWATEQQWLFCNKLITHIAPWGTHLGCLSFCGSGVWPWHHWICSLGSQVAVVKAEGGLRWRLDWRRTFL